MNNHRKEFWTAVTGVLLALSALINSQIVNKKVDESVKIGLAVQESNLIGLKNQQMTTKIELQQKDREIEGELSEIQKSANALNALFKAHEAENRVVEMTQDKQIDELKLNQKEIRKELRGGK